MEPKFQNTFIPKRPIVSTQKNVAVPPRHKTSFLGILVKLIFIIVLLTAGGIFGYGKYLNVEISKKKDLLQEEVNKLQPEVINELATIDAQLRLTEKILSSHLVPSRFFEHLGEITLQNVQFTNFSYTAKPDSQPSINFFGIASDYKAVALQSDVFARDKNIIGSMFSNLNLTENGNVTFFITAQVNKQLTSYKK